MATSEDLAKRANDLLEGVTLGDRIQWKDHPITKALFLVARAVRENSREAWEAGMYTTETVEGTAMKNAEAIGTCGAWEEVQEFIETITHIEETDDDSPSGS